MKVFGTLVVVAVSLLGIAHAQNPSPEYHPIRPISDCLRTDRINQWYVVDHKTVIVKTGPDNYLVKLQSDCPRLGIGQSLRFRANQSNRQVGYGAICGEAGETLSSRDQPPCAIQSVAKIDKDQFKQLEAQSKQGGIMHGPAKP